MYESQNATLESCCKAAGISQQSFSLWTVQFGEFGERYKKAKEIQDANYWENIIRPLTKTSLQRLLEGEETEERQIADLSFKGTLTGQTAETVKRGKTQPNPTAVIFALKGLYSEMFVERHKVEGDMQVTWNIVKQYENNDSDEETDDRPRPARRRPDK